MPIEFTKTHLTDSSNNLGLAVKGSSAVGRAYFGQGDGPVFLSEVQCLGTEASLLQCPFGSFVDKHDCSHLEDAGVICLRKYFKIHTHIPCKKAKCRPSTIMNTIICCQLHGFL